MAEVRLLRPLTVGAQKRKKGDVVDTAEFDGPGTVELLVGTGALERVKPGAEAEPVKEGK